MSGLAKLTQWHAEGPRDGGQDNQAGQQDPAFHGVSIFLPSTLCKSPQRQGSGPGTQMLVRAALLRPDMYPTTLPSWDSKNARVRLKGGADLGSWELVFWTLSKHLELKGA